MSRIQEVNESDFETEVLESELPVLVDFWAPWCGPCRMLAPVLTSLAAKMNGLVKMVKLNTDDNAALAARYGIMAIPTLIVFRDRCEAERLTGFLSADELEAWLRKAVASRTET